MDSYEINYTYLHIPLSISLLDLFSFRTNLEALILVNFILLTLWFCILWASKKSQHDNLKEIGTNINSTIHKMVSESIRLM